MLFDTFNQFFTSILKIFIKLNFRRQNQTLTYQIILTLQNRYITQTITMLIKLQFGSQIHMFSGRLNLSALKTHVQKVFKNLPKEYILTYIDSEGDLITVTSEEDLIGITCGMMKMKIIDLEEGMFSAGESSFSDFNDFIGYSDITHNPENGQKNLQEYPSFDAYTEINTKSIDFEEQENLLVSVSREVQFNDTPQQNITKGFEDESLLFSFSKEYIYDPEKAAIDRAMQEEQIIAQMNKKYISRKDQKCATKSVLEQQNDITKGCVSSLLDALFANATLKLLQEQVSKPKQNIKKREKLILRPIPKLFRKNISKSLDFHHKTEQKEIALMSTQKEQSIKTVRPKKTPITEMNLHQSQSNSSANANINAEINFLVEQKLKAMLPGIIKKVTKVIESKFTKISCIKCERSELQVQKLINKQLLKKSSASNRREQSLGFNLNN